APGEERRRVPDLSQAAPLRRAGPRHPSRRDAAGASPARRTHRLHGPRPGPMIRSVAAAFDAIAMVAAAVVLTGGQLGSPAAVLVIWGCAGASVVAAVVVMAGGPSVVGWMAIGYVVFAAQRAADQLSLLLIFLALAFVPLLPRPRRSLAFGVGVSLATAVA